jgi:2-hydroxychromene-2-carboxylate isomerase
MDTAVTSVDFHFDIMGPWAYQASIWMREVRDRLGLQVRWRFFSLEEINRAEGKKHPWQRSSPTSRPGTG